MNIRLTADCCPTFLWSLIIILRLSAISVNAYPLPCCIINCFEIMKQPIYTIDFSISLLKQILKSIANKFIWRIVVSN